MTSDRTEGRDPPPLHVQDFLTYRLARVHAKLTAQASWILSHGPGISLMQWRVLAILGDEGRLTRAELSRLSDLDKGQISHCLKSMIKAALVIADEDAADHRQQHLTLTVRGREIYRQTAPIVIARQKQILSCLDPDESRALLSALERLEEFAEKRQF